MRKGPTAGTEMTIGWGVKTFSRDALDKIHAATLDVLLSTGLSVACDEALDIIEKGGFRVNRNTEVVIFPDHIVQQS